jgi:membrane associated rhomboid family serine protease
VTANRILSTPAAWALLLVNVIIFAALNLSPGLADVFLLDPGRIMERPWSLFTVFFSHELLIHIALNMFLLLVFGTRLEKAADARVLFSVYVLCGFLGSLTIPAYASVIGYAGGPIAGASASAFGVAAACAALQPDAVVLKSKAKHWIVALFIVNALLTVQNPHVSVGGPAHAVGIAAGAVFGYALRKKSGGRTV